MSQQHPPDSTYQNAGEAIQAAEIALKESRFDDAKHLVNVAERLSSPNPRTQKLLRRIKVEEQDQDKRAKTSQSMGFYLGIGVYTALSFLIFPTNVGTLVWASLTLIFVPLFLGLAVGRRAGYDSTYRQRFSKAFWGVGGAVWLYGFGNLIFWRARFTMESAGPDMLLVWGIVPCFYALVAGAVAGVVSARLAWLREERGA
jgi:hypothetical protein